MKNRRDLFLSKEKQLLRWCRQKKVFSKADIMAFGSSVYYLRADRTVRDFVQQGRVRRLSEKEQTVKGLKGKMAWYEFVKV